MKSLFVSFIFLAAFFLPSAGPLHAQEIICDDPAVTDAYRLAIHTVDINIRRGVLAAGADYGGDWTRDISINSWNAVSLIRPEVAERSLWHVTVDKDTIGDQYWDKVIWIIAAYNHYKATGNLEFLRQAYRCSAKTMQLMEGRQFDGKYGLFMGPSVFNDGIAGYPAPIYDSSNTASGAMENKNTLRIKCLSTNCIYYGAYLALVEMGRLTAAGDDVVEGYGKRASALKTAILQHFYDAPANRLYYLIDQDGRRDDSQEALGLSFAVIFGIVEKQQALGIIHDAHASRYGIASIYPDFARYSADHPGRHNNLIWPMVNGFFAKAAIVAGDRPSFVREWNGLTSLALDKDKGDYDFREIYNPSTGQPDGGWQANGPSHPDFHWASCKLQTWSATAYLSMIYDGVIGLHLDKDRLLFTPYMPDHIHLLTVKNIRYRSANLNITLTGKGHTIKSFTVNGKKQAGNALGAGVKGFNDVVIEMQ